jgi:hypothetical protein
MKMTIFCTNGIDMVRRVGAAYAVEWVETPEADPIFQRLTSDTSFHA